MSESLLDCRDIGTSPLNGEEIDQFIRSSQGLLQAAIADSEHVTNGESLADYKPIQQVNVQLLGQDQIDLSSQ